MQAFARHSFFGLFFLNNKRVFLRDFPVKPLLESREARCLEMPSLRASRLSLDNEEDGFLRWESANRLDFCHTVCAEGIKTDTVLRRDEIGIKF